MQTILGAGGAIGKLLAKELVNYTNKVRLVARNPQLVNDSDELMVADLTDAAAVLKAVAGSEVVYLCAGIAYELKVWQKQWPEIMYNVIRACIQHKAKLVFLDNVYMYANSAIPAMTESSPLDPPSEKGKVRLQIAQMITDASASGQLKALIARSADFYGPGVNTSVLKISVFDNFEKGKKAMWLSDATKIHSFTYTPDIAKAMALLGNTADAYGEVWHLPTSTEKLTGKEFIKMIADEMKVKPAWYTLSKLMLKLLAIFIPMLRELKEMQYQNDQDYFFDSSKFQQKFGMQPTSYTDGIKAIVQDMK
ncbi:MAG: NAD-dependent epimerase/dehydratase family protein [Ferruginibacter sp.]